MDSKHRVDLRLQVACKVSCLFEMLCLLLMFKYRVRVEAIWQVFSSLDIFLC